MGTPSGLTSRGSTRTTRPPAASCQVRWRRVGCGRGARPPFARPGPVLLAGPASWLPRDFLRVCPVQATAGRWTSAAAAGTSATRTSSATSERRSERLACGSPCGAETTETTPAVACKARACRRCSLPFLARASERRSFNAFDRAMMHLEKAFGFVCAPHQWISKMCGSDKIIVAERGDLLFVFNFHPTASYTDYRVGCYGPGPYKVRLATVLPLAAMWTNRLGRAAARERTAWQATDVACDCPLPSPLVIACARAGGAEQRRGGLRRVPQREQEHGRHVPHAGHARQPPQQHQGARPLPRTSCDLRRSRAHAVPARGRRAARPAAHALRARLLPPSLPRALPRCRCTRPAAPWWCTRRPPRRTRTPTSRAGASPAWASRAWGPTTRAKEEQAPDGCCVPAARPCPGP